MDVTIIIPSYRSEKTIERCLRSLLTQDTAFIYEIILVDSSIGSGVDETACRFPKVKLIKLTQKTYAGIARNIGAKEARGELLVFIDDDIIVPNDWLENVVKYYRSGHTVFSSSIDFLRHEENNIIARLEWYFEFSEFKPTMKEGTRWCLPSGALAVKKEIFQNDKFINMKRAQDVEFTVRLKKIGNILYFNPKLKVFHIFDTTFYRLVRKTFISGLNNMRIRKIHNVSGSYFIRIPILCFIAIPGFAIVKLTRISFRNILYNNLRDKLLYIFIFPYIVLLVIAWMSGAYRFLLLCHGQKKSGGG